MHPFSSQRALISLEFISMKTVLYRLTMGAVCSSLYILCGGSYRFNHSSDMCV